MNKANIRNLSLVGLVGAIVGFILFTAGAVGGTTATDGTTTTLTSVGNPTLVTIGTIILGLTGIASLVAWIFGLIRTAQLQRWGWFVAVLLLGSLGALIYGLAGPEISPAQATMPLTPPTGYR